MQNAGGIFQILRVTSILVNYNITHDPKWIFHSECLCSDEGSLSCACTEEEGICHCKENIEGNKCDQCKPGYWSYPSCHGKHKYTSFIT